MGYQWNIWKGITGMSQDQPKSRRRQHPRDVQIARVSDRVRKELDAISDVPKAFLRHVTVEEDLVERVRNLLAAKGLLDSETEKHLKTLDSMMIFYAGVKCCFCGVEFEVNSDQLHLWFTDSYVGYACIDRSMCESVCLTTT
jgi:hypothetical protein